MDESLLAMLRSVATPSELETRQIRHILAQQQSKLEQVSAKVTEARAVLDQLLAEEAEATRTHDACLSLLSPIRCLPPELLGMIFISCIPDDSFVRPEQRQAPVLLTRVSVSWRAIAFSIPELWSSLRIVYDMKGRGKDRSKYIDRIIAPSMSLWLSRSGRLPLSISVERMSLKQSILDVLSNHSTRCRRLELKSPHLLPGLEIPDMYFPILKQLHVDSLIPRRGLFLSTFASAPELREVYWKDGSYPDRPGLTLSLPWAQLKRLTFGSGHTTMTHVGILLDIFAMCPLLEYASVAFEGKNYTTPRNQILLPHLSSLVLNATSHLSDYTSIFTHLVTPRLRNLTCECGTAWPPQVFSSFIDRSACALDGLHLRFLSRFTQITQYLQIVSSSVKSLDIRNQHSIIITDELFKLLTPTLERPCLCPNLEILNLLGCVSQTRGALAAMIRSRIHIGADAYPPVNRTKGLQRLGILHTERDLDELCYLQRYGLVVIITKTAPYYDI
jgi:hypothetical protein